MKRAERGTTAMRRTRKLDMQSMSRRSNTSSARPVAAPSAECGRFSALGRSRGGKECDRSRAQGKDKRGYRRTERRSPTRRLGSSLNGSSCAIRTLTRTSADTQRSLPIVRAGRVWASCARRAEARLWQEHSDAATVRDFVGNQPTSAKGRFALARLLLAEGDRDDAERMIRQAWRSDELSERSEAEAFELFRRPAHARGPSCTHGQAHRRQGYFRREARCAAPRQRRAFDREGLCGRKHATRRSICSTTLRPRPAVIWDTHFAVSAGWRITTGSTKQPV